jgi:hypothetical protein
MVHGTRIQPDPVHAGVIAKDVAKHLLAGDTETPAEDQKDAYGDPGLYHLEFLLQKDVFFLIYYNSVSNTFKRCFVEKVAREPVKNYQ